MRFVAAASNLPPDVPARGSRFPDNGQVLTILGLGPGSASHLTRQSFDELISAPRVYLRTRHHPTVAEIDGSDAWLDCDDLYASSNDFDSVYRAIADRILSAARDGDVVYAVPGNPLVAERSVTLVLSLAKETGVPVRVLPALSFVDLAAVALGVDAGNLQVCDALDLRVDPLRPALIHQVHDRDSATALKLRLLEIYPADHPATLLRGAGSAVEEVRELPLSSVDHIAYGYLDALYLPALDPLEDVRRLEGAYHVVVERLNADEGGCPWDVAQTHESLRKYLLEETYEVLGAIDARDPAALAEELGDLLLQVFEHVAVARREDTFSMGDVTEKLTRKLIHRHPHVFGDAALRTATEVEGAWEGLKKKEKPAGTSVLDGVPLALPSLQASQSMQSRARKTGFEWPDISGALDKLAEEIQEFAEADGDAAAREDEFGDILFVLAGIAQRLGIDAEQALRLSNTKFRARFTLVEKYAIEDATPLDTLDLDGLNRLWARAKAEVAAK